MPLRKRRNDARGKAEHRKLASPETGLEARNHHFGIGKDACEGE
jgi:hypothetical protein